MLAYIPNPYKANELPNNGGQGWLRVLTWPGNKSLFLPMYLKVNTLLTPKSGDADREYFTIMEGLEKGRQASTSKVQVKENCSSFLWFEYGCTLRRDSRLLKNIAFNNACLIRYQKVKAITKGYNAETELTRLEVGLYNNGGAFNPVIASVEVIHQFDLLKPGLYKLKIPGAEHVKKGKKYLGDTLFATTWYLIDEPLYKDDLETPQVNEKGRKARYFHPGNGSAGCLTIRSRQRHWTKVVQFVSRCRLDDQYVGYVQILPEKTNEN